MNGDFWGLFICLGSSYNIKCDCSKQVILINVEVTVESSRCFKSILNIPHIFYNSTLEVRWRHWLCEIGENLNLIGVLGEFILESRVALCLICGPRLDSFGKAYSQRGPVSIGLISTSGLMLLGSYISMFLKHLSFFL